MPAKAGHAAETELRPSVPQCSASARMGGVKSVLYSAELAVFAFLVCVAPAAAQTGAVEFTARVTPAAGRAEPVRGLPFYLLRKSYAEIRKEVDATEAKPDLDAFIDRLQVSKELKAWMRRAHSVSLSGEQFTHRLKVDDIMNVPEFFNAYLERNVGDRSVGFPQPKYRPSDAQRDPQKYEKQKQEYLDAVRKFLAANPQSADGIDLGLTEIDPSHDWEQLEAQRLPAIHRRALELAESRYLAARTETDLDGNGAIRGVAPGNYWLSTLDIDATIGDVRLRWDTPVRVRAGQTTRAELSNINATEPHRGTP